jgi:arginyl-tRNA synthetase
MGRYADDETGGMTVEYTMETFIESLARKVGSLRWAQEQAEAWAAKAPEGTEERRVLQRAADTYAYAATEVRAVLQRVEETHQDLAAVVMPPHVKPGKWVEVGN